MTSTELPYQDFALRRPIYAKRQRIGNIDVSIYALAGEEFKGRFVLDTPQAGAAVRLRDVELPPDISSDNNVVKYEFMAKQLEEIFNDCMGPGTDERFAPVRDWVQEYHQEIQETLWTLSMEEPIRTQPEGPVL